MPNVELVPFINDTACLHVEGGMCRRFVSDGGQLSARKREEGKRREMAAGPGKCFLVTGPPVSLNFEILLLVSMSLSLSLRPQVKLSTLLYLP